MVCVRGGAISLHSLSPARPSTSDLRGSCGRAGLQVMLGSRQKWSPSLSSKCPLQLAIRPTCGFFLGASPLCHLGGLSSLPPVLTEPDWEPLLSTTSGSSEQTRGPGKPAPGGKHGRLATQLPSAVLTSLQVLPAPSSHSGPGSGTRCSWRTCISNRFLNCPGRDATKTASQSRVCFFAHGSF